MVSISTPASTREKAWILHELKKIKDTTKRISEWNKLANSEKEDKIKRFVFRWISFNGLYNAAYAVKHGQNRADSTSQETLIKWFCENVIDKELATKIYSDDIKQVFLNQIKDKSRGTGKYLEGLKNENPCERVKNLVLIAYKIRCRLFHGGKTPSLEVNVEVCDVADKVIAPILTYFLESHF